MDLFRNVMMSRLIVLGQSLLLCLWVGRVYGAFVGKIFVARLRPSASKFCMESAAAITCWRVSRLIFGGGV